MSEKVKILIIGSEGFIGSNAVSYFKSYKNKVYCADILAKEESDYSFINPVQSDYSELFKNQKFDICINASGAANVSFSFQNPSQDFTLNTGNVYHILESIRLFNPKCKFINISSAAVYGNPQYLPIDEKHDINPISPYGFHKYYSENICREFNAFFDIQTVSLRVFSAYGPGLRKQLFWDLHQKFLSKNEIAIYGTGNESRDFIFIEDLLKAIDCIIEKADFKGECINVATGEEIRISEIVNLFYRELDKNAVYKFTGEGKQGDPKNWRADISQLTKLGFEPTISIESGIKNTVQWLKTQ